MAKTEEIGEEFKELKAKLLEGKAVVGKEKVFKGLRDKNLYRVYLASNCPQEIREDIQYYAKLAKIPVVELSMDNEELGLFCKKGFFIAVLGTRV